MPGPALQRVIVVIPALNEAGTIGRVVRGAREALPGATILVVDDGSMDPTAALAAGAGADVLSMPFNTGYGAAIQTGIKRALRGGWDVAIICDGDGQHDTGSIAPLLAAFAAGRADIVVGSRYLVPGGFETPPLKRVAVRLFAALAGLSIGQRVTDPTSGFKALNRRAMRYYVSDLLPISFPDADALITAHRVGLQIVEVPVVMSDRTEGRSMHDGFKGFLYFFNMLFSMFVSVLRRDAFNLEGCDDDSRPAAQAKDVRDHRGAAVPGADIQPRQAP